MGRLLTAYRGISTRFFLRSLFAILILAGGMVAEIHAEDKVAQENTFCYDASGKSVDCAGTGQDGDTRSGLPWPEPRFLDNLDGTITDNLTGLMWLKNNECMPKRSWQGAFDAVATLNNTEEPQECKGYSAKHNDWSLPNVNELASLVLLDEPDTAAALNRLGFTGLQPLPYWTSTTAANPYNSWAVDFGSGAVNSLVKIDQLLTIPVRKATAVGISQPLPTGQLESILPGDDGELQRGFPIPENRFTDNGDNTITDTATGLMWVKSPSTGGEKTWQEALDEIRNVNNGATSSFGAIPHRNWRLPNRIELASLVSFGTDFPALPSDNPFTIVPKAPHWTSTTYSSIPAEAWTVDFDDGAILPTPKNDKNHFWLVRSTTEIAPVLGQSSLWKTGEPRKLSLAAKRIIEQEEEDEPGRFIDMGDGTIIDSKTGIMWLKDAGCMGKASFGNAFSLINFFNIRPEKFNCKDYTAPYKDWGLPGSKTLSTLIRKSEPNISSWLNTKGFTRVQPHNYWNATPNKANIYYGRLHNLKTGEKNTYSKSLRFFVWPARTLSGKIALPQAVQTPLNFNEYMKDVDPEGQAGASQAEQLPEDVPALEPETDTGTAPYPLPELRETPSMQNLPDHRPTLPIDVGEELLYNTSSGGPTDEVQNLPSGGLTIQETPLD